MAKKTTSKTTPNLGARGQANLSIVAAAGQRFAPVKLDISGYVKALGSVAKVLVAREEAALSREEAVTLSDEIMGSDLFQSMLKEKRDDAIAASKKMKNTLPFTQAHKDAKKEYENTKNLIQGFKPVLDILDKKNAALDGIVTKNSENGDLEFNISSVNDPNLVNYLTAFYNGEFKTNGMFDLDGKDGPEKPQHWFDQDALKNGEIKILNVDGKYVSPKDLNFTYTVKGAGSKITASIFNFIGDTNSETKFNILDSSNNVSTTDSEYVKMTNQRITELSNLYDQDPNAFLDSLFGLSLQITPGSTNEMNFVQYYIANIDETLNDAPEEIKRRAKEINEMTDTDAKKKALELFVHAIRKADPTFKEDALKFIRAAFMKSIKEQL